MRVPIDHLMTALLPYRAERGSFPYLSANDVLHGSIQLEALSKNIVPVGTTAPGLFAVRAAPIAKVYPAVEIHANLIVSMLDGTMKQLPSYVVGEKVASLLLTGLAMTVLLTLLSPLCATLFTAFALTGLVALNLAVWNNGNLVLPLASSLLMVALLFALNMSYGYFFDTGAKRQIAKRFVQYVPPALVNEMSRHPEALSMAGGSRELSVLFTGVRGLSAISESLQRKRADETHECIFDAIDKGRQSSPRDDRQVHG